MAKRRSYPEAYLPMKIEVEFVDLDDMTPKQLQDWKDLCTWVLSPLPEREEARRRILL